MAVLLRPGHDPEHVLPANGNEFTLQELQGFVGGYIELLKTRDGLNMFVNEDGKRLGLPPNTRATFLYGRDVIVGTAIVCQPGEVS